MLYIYTYTHNLTRKFKIILPGKIQEGKGGEGILVFRKFRISISLTIVMRLVDMYISSLDGNRRCIVSLSLSLSLPLCSRNRDPEIRQGRKRDSGGRTPRRELLYDFWANDLKRRIISERRRRRQHRLEFCAKQICNYPGEIETCVEGGGTRSSY